MNDDELIRLAKAGNVEVIQELLERCHPALMKVWKVYRDGMMRRGIRTNEVKQDLLVRVWDFVSQEK